MNKYDEELGATARIVVEEINKQGVVDCNIIMGHISSIASAHNLTKRIVDEDLNRAVNLHKNNERQEGWE